MGRRDQTERLATGRVKFHGTLHSFRYLDFTFREVDVLYISVAVCVMLIPRSSRDASPSSDSEEWVIVQNGEVVSTDSPSRSPGDSDASLHLRPARPPNPTSHRQTASPSKKSVILFPACQNPFFHVSLQSANSSFSQRSCL